MEGFNLKEMSYQELKELEKAIREAKNNKAHKFKGEMGISQRLKDIFDEDVKELGVEESERNDFYYRMERNLFSVCDISTGNFRANKKQKADVLAVWLNTASLDCEIDTCCYTDMMNELFELIEKYHNMWSNKRRSGI